MKKVTLISMLVITSFTTIFAQESYKETFDSNSLEWTEAPKKFAGPSAIIDEGVMKLQLSGGLLTSSLQFIETHCYAPIDVQKPFTIKTNVNIKTIPADGAVGLIFNYKDDGNFYMFKISMFGLAFCRYENNVLVGSITRPMSWGTFKDIQQEWELISDNQTLRLNINEEPMLKVKYMPLQYSGVGFYATGKGQSLSIDDIEFIQ